MGQGGNIEEKPKQEMLGDSFWPYTSVKLTFIRSEVLRKTTWDYFSQLPQTKQNSNKGHLLKFDVSMPLTGKKCEHS